MPVPVSPQRPVESSQGQDAATPSEAAVVPSVPAAPQQQQQHRRQLQQQSPQEPAGETPNTDNSSASIRSNTDPGVLAGYRDCLRETIRYLVEEEKMALDHPVILGLKDHLERQQAYLELEKLSHQLSGDHWQISSAGQTRSVVPRTSGFQITLVEDDDSDDDEELLVVSEDEDEDLVVVSEDEDEMEEVEVEEEEECEDMEDSNDEELQEEEEEESNSSNSEALPLAEELLSDPNVRRELLRMMYQGCDLFASPPPAHHSAILLQW